MAFLRAWRKLTRRRVKLHSPRAIYVVTLSDAFGDIQEVLFGTYAYERWVERAHEEVAKMESIFDTYNYRMKIERVS